jgi:hypothetical protein
MSDEPIVEVVPEGTPAPEYDFMEGDLGAKVRQLKEKLAEAGLVPKPDEGTARTPDEIQKDAGPLKGSDVDWDAFDLDPNYAHFYSQSQFTVTAQGPKWVVVIDEYESAEKPYNGKGVNKLGAPNGLGAYVTSKVNSPPDRGVGPWKLAAILPATMGNGAVVLVRKVPIVLPDPKLLETETKVDAPTPDELAETDDAATKWAEPDGSSGPLPADLGPAPRAARALADQIAGEVLEGPDTE